MYTYSYWFSYMHTSIDLILFLYSNIERRFRFLRRMWALFNSFLFVWATYACFQWTTQTKYLQLRNIESRFEWLTRVWELFNSFPRLRHSKHAFNAHPPTRRFSYIHVFFLRRFSLLLHVIQIIYMPEAAVPIIASPNPPEKKGRRSRNNVQQVQEVKS